MKVRSIVCVGTVALIIGCVGTRQEGSTTSSANTEHEDDIIAFHLRSEYLKQLSRDIGTAASKGDFEPARLYLMTDAMQKEYTTKFGPAYHPGKLCNYQTTIFYFLVAVRLLPEQGTREVFDLLRQYYYGENCSDQISLSDKVIKSLVSQLVIGAHVGRDRYAVSDKVDVRRVEEGSYHGASDVVVLVTYRNGIDAFLWRFKFRQIDSNGRAFWIPVEWSNAGYID